MLSILYFSFIPLGIFLATCAYKLGKDIFSTPVYLEMPYLMNEAIFTLPQKGKYSIWNKAPQRMKVPVDVCKPQVIHLNTNTEIHLSRSVLRANTTNMKFESSMELYNFKAEAGDYQLKLIDGSSIAFPKLEKAISQPIVSLAGKEFNPAKYFILIKKYLYPLLIMAFVWSILLSIGCVVAGFVLGFVSLQ